MYIRRAAAVALRSAVQRRNMLCTCDHAFLLQAQGFDFQRSNVRRPWLRPPINASDDVGNIRWQHSPSAPDLAERQQDHSSSSAVWHGINEDEPFSSGHVHDPSKPSQLQKEADHDALHSAGSWKQSAAAAGTISEAEMVEEVPGPQSTYDRRRKAGLYRHDPQQEVAVQQLQELYESLQAVFTYGSSASGKKQKRPSGLTMVDSLSPRPQQPLPTRRQSDKLKPAASSWWSNLLGSASSRMQAKGNDGAVGGSSSTHVKGLYMYGGVGCGKTMLMDVFVAAAPPEFKVLRTHFHEFMLDVHTRLRDYHDAPDPLVHVARSIAEECHVLALDEFFVTDVADAMILNRLFSRLWELDVVLVATSNRAPDALYENGLQRQLFLPFIERLKQYNIVHNMSSPVDYRKLAQHQHGLYFVQAPGEGDQLLQKRFQELANSAPPAPTTVEVMMGRKLEVPLAADDVCFFTFQDLCGRPAGAADYAALVKRFHTLCLSGVPVFSGGTRSEAYRFCTLIDVLYEHRMRLIVSAEGTPFDLYECVLTQAQALADTKPKCGKDVVVDDNLGFAKDRIISRLTEMQSVEYLLSHAEQHAPHLLLALREQQNSMRKAATGSAAA